MIQQINNIIDILWMAVGLISIIVLLVVLIFWKKDDDNNDPHSFI